MRRLSFAADASLANKVAAKGSDVRLYELEAIVFLW